MNDDTPTRPQAEHALRVVESMTSGVVTLDAGGRVTAFNQRAAEITGIDAAKIVGESLVAAFLEDPHNEHLADVVVEASYDETSRYHRQVDYHRDGQRLVLDLRASLLHDASGAAAGVVLVIDDITETALLRESEQKLADELRTRNATLTEAYRNLEDKGRSLDTATRRLRTLGMVAIAMALVVVGAAAYYAWTSVVPPAPTRVAAPAGAAAGGVVVAPRPLRQSVTVTGTIEPGKVVEVTAPFAGGILSRNFVYGARIEQGQEILRLDIADIERERRTAMVAAMNARQKVEDLRAWERGTEVQRARRQLAQTRQNLERAQQQLQTAGELLAKGIIAKQEFDSLQQQRAQQELQLFSSEQDLAATIRKGSEEQITIARLEAANAEEKLANFERQIAAARILAPVSGVALRPRAAAQAGGAGGDSGSAGRELAVGTRVEQGRTLLEIGDLATLSVRGQVDEIDVSRVKPGLAVGVQGSGFGGHALRGRVAAVSSQANVSGSGRSARARFDVLVTIEEVPPAVRENLRIGMSAALDVVIYEKSQAIVVPPDMIRRGPDGPRMKVRKGAQGEPQEVAVTLGVSLPQGVEIVAGLAPGDEVMRP
ncbi:MAG: PAS domain S-box protein [Alphaproteobacteria bacterium]